MYARSSNFLFIFFWSNSNNNKKHQNLMEKKCKSKNNKWKWRWRKKCIHTYSTKHITWLILGQENSHSIDIGRICKNMIVRMPPTQFSMRVLLSLLWKKKRKNCAVAKDCVLVIGAKKTKEEKKSTLNKMKPDGEKAERK